MADKTLVDVRNAIDQLGNSIPDNMKKPIEEVFSRMQEKKLTVQEALSINPTMIESIYAEGYKLFKSGKYRDAIAVFTFLRNFEPESYRYSFAVASCYQYLKEYNSALENYLLCTNLDLHNPIPHFHMYDCFMKLDYPFAAFRELIATILLANQDLDKYSSLKEKATLEFKKLKKDLKNHPLNKIEE